MGTVTFRKVDVDGIKVFYVGSDEAKAVRELRDKIAEHVTGGGKSVQQHDRWRVLWPGFAIVLRPSFDGQH